MTTKPDLHGAYFRWAKSEEEMLALEALGWEVADQRRTHHHNWALLMRWCGDGPPRMTAP